MLAQVRTPPPSTRRTRVPKPKFKLNAWGGKDRPLSESMTNPEFFRDPPREVARLMGGRPFFQEIQAQWLHRVGLFGGLCWCLPYSGASKNINYTRVTLEEGGKTFQMMFGKVNTLSNYIPDTIEEVKTITGVAASKLREVYERETVDA